MKDSNGYFHIRIWHGKRGVLAVADVTITHAGEEPTDAGGVECASFRIVIVEFRVFL